MPEANAALFNLEGLSPGELEAMRRNLIAEMAKSYKSYDDPDLPIEKLRLLAVLTSTLRRKNAGPPKAAKPPRSSKAATTDDLLI